MYEDNQESIKRVLADIITPQSISIDALIPDLNNLCLQK